MMKRIYECTIKVYDWLGQPCIDRETEMAVELMFKMHLLLRNSLAQNDNDMSALHYSVNEDHEFFPKNQESDLWTSWQGIAEMMNQKYWRRVWIYQEATTPGNVIFYYGPYSFTITVLHAIIYFGRTFSAFPAFDATFSGAVGQGSDVSNLYTVAVVREAGRERRLADLLQGLKQANCTDQRDRVYAPLSRAEDIGPDQFAIDLDEDESSLFVRDAKDVLLKLPSLEMLSFCCLPAPEAENRLFKGSSGIAPPSWVPNRNLRVHLQRFTPCLGLSNGTAPLYNPSPGSLVEATVCGSTLIVKGHIVNDADIEILGRVCDRDENAQETPRLWRQEVIQAFSEDANIAEAIDRSLVGDRELGDRKHSNYKDTLCWTRGRVLEWQLLEKPQKTLSTDESTRVHSDRMALDATCFERRLAVLNYKRVAILPAAAAKCDRVAALCGATTLHLVKPIPGLDHTYHYVGECYVDGWMNGALMTTRLRDKDSVALRLV